MNSARITARERHCQASAVAESEKAHLLRAEAFANCVDVVGDCDVGVLSRVDAFRSPEVSARCDDVALSSDQCGVRCEKRRVELCRERGTIDFRGREAKSALIEKDDVA